MVLLRIGVAIALAFGGASAFAKVERPSPGHWPLKVFRWYYNPQHHPIWLSDEDARQQVQNAAKPWEACGIRMQYEGETALRPGRIDGVNVVGWDARLTGGTRAVTLGQANRAAGILLERDTVYDPGRQEFREFPRLLKKVMIHEFGHAIGLTHSARCDDVMTLAADCPPIPAARLPITLQPHDLERCKALYGSAR